MNDAEAFGHSEVVAQSPEASFESVAHRAYLILNALDEALESYAEVTLPTGETIETVHEHERLVAKAQRLLEGLQGLREQVTTKNEYHAERGVAMLEDAVTALTEYLSVRADLLNEVSKNPAAQQLVTVLDRIVATLVPELPAPASNGEQYFVEKNVA